MRYQVKVALHAPNAHIVFGGYERTLRQTLIALRAGSFLQEHENPGDAIVHVVQGRVALTCGDDAWDGLTGDLVVVPDAPHGWRRSRILLFSSRLPSIDDVAATAMGPERAALSPIESPCRAAPGSDA